jgi:TATA-box binding protein (TBP) (component of TFIID and TFIIIB)
MYNAIANDTFHYISTLNEFKKKFPDVSWVKITTITMIADLETKIDVAFIRKAFQTLGNIVIKQADKKNARGFEWTLKETTFYNQVTLNYVDEYSTKSIKLFPNGAIQVAGCTDLIDCNRVIRQLVKLLKLLVSKDIKTKGFQVVMINSNFSLNYKLNLHEVAVHFSRNKIFDVSFDPDRYSAVKIKFKPAEDMKRVTVSIFGTGKIIVTGAETLKEIAFSYNIINSHINTNKNIKVEKTDTIDEFNEIFGYTFDDMVKFVTRKNWLPWRFTQTNYKINF